MYIYKLYIVFKNSDTCSTVNTLYAMYNQFVLYKSISFHFPQNWSSNSTFEIRCNAFSNSERNTTLLCVCLSCSLHYQYYICSQYCMITLHHEIEQLTYLYVIAKVMRIISQYCDGTFKYVWFWNGILWYFQSTMV